LARRVRRSLVPTMNSTPSMAPIQATTSAGAMTVTATTPSAARQERVSSAMPAASADVPSITTWMPAAAGLQRTWNPESSFGSTWASRPSRSTRSRSAVSWPSSA
jgi:hypothetical protein